MSIDGMARDGALKAPGLALNSADARSLAKARNLLKPGGQVISIFCPAHARFAQSLKVNLHLMQLTRILSPGLLKQTKARGVGFSFLSTRADGAHLDQWVKLIDAGPIRPMVDRVFPLALTPEALA